MIAVSTDVVAKHRRRVERSDEVDRFYPILALSDVTVAI